MGSWNRFPEEMVKSDKVVFLETEPDKKIFGLIVHKTKMDSSAQHISPGSTF